MKTKTIQILLLSGLFLLGSCKNERKSTTDSKTTFEIQNEEKHSSTINKDLLVGSWKDNSESALHFTLFKNGSARSDNMETLLYKKWKLSGNQIIFTVESVGNGTSSIDDETYIIDKLTEDRLVLKNGEYLFEYTKK